MASLSLAASTLLLNHKEKKQFAPATVIAKQRPTEQRNQAA